MLISQRDRERLDSILTLLKLKNEKKESSKDKACKIEQIIAFLEAIHVEIRHYSKKRQLTLIDAGAGNCYLSFLVYCYYTMIDKRDIVIHCIDRNNKLMEKCRRIADELGYQGMQFHALDIEEFRLESRVEMVYALHACDSATDKALYLGLMHKAATVLSVSCCQHHMKQQMKTGGHAGITKHSVFKDRFVYMVGDSLRGLLMEMRGYRVTIFEFVSSRYTDKNIMLKARKSSIGKLSAIREEFRKIKSDFRVTPELERLLDKERLADIRIAS